MSALPVAFSLGTVVLEAVRSHRICTHSPGSAGRMALPRRISCAGSCGRVGSSRYDTVEDSTWLPGEHLLAIAKSSIRLDHYGHGNGSISTHHVRQPVRTLGNFALVRLGRPCEVFSDCLEAMAVQGGGHESDDDTCWAARKRLCTFFQRRYRLLLRHGALSLGGWFVVGQDGAVERFKLSPLPVNLVLK